MKTKIHRIIVFAILLTTIQIAKSKTFELVNGSGRRSEIDSAMNDRRSEIDTIPKLIEVFTDYHLIDSLAALGNNRRADTTGMTGSMRGSNYANLHPHIPNQFAINTSKTVGEIPIQHHVDANGATTYTVPIECAPGRAGMQPSISLIYNSLRGNGVLGYGWGIGGISAINRVPSNFYYDETTKPTDITSPGTFVMDGVRLHKV